MEPRNEKDVAVEKLQNALLKLPKDDLMKLLKNTYQAMRIKHSIPQEKKAPELFAEAASLRKKSTKQPANGRTTANGTPKTRSDSVHLRQNTKQEDKNGRRGASRTKNKKVQDTHCSDDADPDVGDLQVTFRETDPQVKSDPKVPQLDLERAQKGIFQISGKGSGDPMTPTFSPKRSDRDVGHFVENFSAVQGNVAENVQNWELPSIATECGYSMHPDAYTRFVPTDSFGMPQDIGMGQLQDVGMPAQEPFNFHAHNSFGRPEKPFGTPTQETFVARRSESYKLQTHEVFNTTQLYGPSTHKEPFGRDQFGQAHDPFVKEPHGIKYSMVPVDEYGQPVYNVLAPNLYNTPKICVKGPFFTRTRLRF